MLETPLTGGFCVLWQRAYYANLWVHILLWLHCSAYYFWPDRIRQANSQLRFEIYIETVCQCFSKVAALWGETEVNFNGMRSRPDAGRTSPKWVGWPEQETKVCFVHFICTFSLLESGWIPENITWDMTSPWHIRTWVQEGNYLQRSKIWFFLTDLSQKLSVVMHPCIC